MRKGLRQLMYPREFRIAPHAPPSGAETTIKNLIHTLVANLRGETETGDPAGEPLSLDVDPEQWLTFLANVATGLWRLKQKMVQPGTDEPLDEMRRAFRHLESLWDIVVQEGVEIRDHTGDLVPESGVYGLKTLAIQPTPGLARQTVIETIKPSIFFQGQMIQMGEVIIGAPET